MDDDDDNDDDDDDDDEEEEEEEERRRRGRALVTNLEAPQKIPQRDTDEAAPQATCT